MNFTFGIITGGSSNHRESNFWGDAHSTGNCNDIGLRIRSIIDTIDDQNIPNYEVIVVGGDNYYEDLKSVKHIEFDEDMKWAWITKKKNLITYNANYENVVYMHDYISLDKNWYSGYLKYGNDWDVCLNVINNIEGHRWLDLLLIHDSGYHVIAPYDYIESHRKGIYVSGAYWIAKRDFMIKFPLNESLSWGDGEDIEWSERWMFDNEYKFNMNVLSSCRVCKENKIYSAPHLFRSGAEAGFGTKDVNEMIKWYGRDASSIPDSCNPPWLIDDIERN